MADAPRVRFAPSPTGYLHVGGARTALFNWLFARRHGGSFVLRIEDTDRERSSEEMTRAILDGMRWLGLEWDEGPHYQADGIPRHSEAAEFLLSGGHAYRCFCTAVELQAKRVAAEGTQEEYRYDRCCLGVAANEAERRAALGEAFTLRFRVPDGHVEWDDSVHGAMRFRNADIEDFIILRSDGTPTYNLAVVSDDIEMRITHVIRGDDHLSNTPKQVLLYRALGAAVPVFGHLPMILGQDGKRLSKRHGATAVGEYAHQGILPQTLANFLALLGWSPGEDREIMTREEMVSLFSIARINKKSAVFDPAKLEWMNGQHLSLLDGAALLELAAHHLIDQGLTSAEEITDRHSWFAGLMELLKPRARRVEDLATQALAYLAPVVEYEREAVTKHWKEPGTVVERLRVVEGALRDLDSWEAPAIEGVLRAAAEQLGVGFGKIVHPLRLALTGAAVSPRIDQVIETMGPALVARRIEQACSILARHEQTR
ncbi:MAG: glutamate--tRNA ligase [Gemmatimonadetes bacterium]|nr:glutamate--tRNA ligase [Gemmatimonadota bacterium]